jgi:hypothetical protein
MYTFSYDFGECWFNVGHWDLAFRVDTDENCYTPALEASSLMETADGWLLEADSYSWAGGQQECEGVFRAIIHRHDDAISWTVEAELPRPIKAVTTIVKALSRGMVLDRRLEFRPITPGENEVLQYPTMMPVPVFAVRDEDGGCTVFESDDDQVRAKTFGAQLCEDHLLVELHHHEDARNWNPKIITPAWWMSRVDSPRQALERRMGIMEARWGLQPWETREDVPDWARRTSLVLNLHGTHWTGHVFNTYAQQLEIIRRVAGEIDGGYVLAFLAAWDGRYNFDWPRYEADDVMGGDAGLHALVEGAHKLGVHVVPQYGAVSANKTFLPEELHDCCLHDAYGNAYVKDLDWDMDRIMANIGHPDFRKFLTNKIIHLIEDFGFDGTFMDFNMLWRNDPWHSPVEGQRLLVEELQQRFPGHLMMGTGWYDALLPLYPIVQDRRRAPGEYGDIFRRYNKLSFHISHPDPSGSMGVFEGGYGEPFLPEADGPRIPTITFAADTLRDHWPEVQSRIEIAKAYCKRQGMQ